MQYSVISEFQQKQDLFNIISGKDKCFTKDDLMNQYDLIVEEGQIEGELAFAHDNAVALLDSAVDTLFVTIGMLQKLRNAGFDVDGAMKQVADDNLTKFTQDEEVAKSSAEKYKTKGIPADYKQSEGYFVVYNTATGKVLKPSTFVSTDLTKYCPVTKISKIGVKIES